MRNLYMSKIVFQFSEIIMVIYHMVLAQLVLHLEENKNVPPSYTKYKSKFQMDQDLTVKN